MLQKRPNRYLVKVCNWLEIIHKIDLPNKRQTPEFQGDHSNHIVGSSLKQHMLQHSHLNSYWSEQ